MALVILTIYDEDDNNANVQMLSEPTIPVGGGTVNTDKMTLAQMYGIAALDAIMKQGKVESTEVG